MIFIGHLGVQLPAKGSSTRALWRCFMLMSTVGIVLPQLKSEELSAATLRPASLRTEWLWCWSVPATSTLIPALTLHS